MQRLLSSCIRSRSLIYAPPRSFLISARFNSSSPIKVELNDKVTDTAGPSKLNDKVKGTEGPSKVLATELKNKVIDTAERASATAVATPDELWSEASKRIMEDMARSPPANAYSGRTVDNPRDLANTFRVLDGILSRNRVRYQLRQTQRHEKKGAKRRRLKSERWRRQFANEVRKKVKLVVKIRKRGA